MGGSPVAPCGRGDAGAVMPGPSALAEALELPGLNAGRTTQGCQKPAVRGPQPQAATQSSAGK